jgi:hypothetical protein
MYNLFLNTVQYVLLLIIFQLYNHQSFNNYYCCVSYCMNFVTFTYVENSIKLIYFSQPKP